MQHGTTKGLLLVTIGWFVDSVKRNVRLKETLYSVNSIGDDGLAIIDFKRLDQSSGAENSCLPSGLLKHTKQSDLCGAPGSQFSERERKRHSTSSSFSGQTFYVDVDVPAELLSKVSEALSAEGAILLDQWFVGCNATYVVCEGHSIQKYMRHSDQCCNIYRSTHDAIFFSPSAAMGSKVCKRKISSQTRPLIGRSSQVYWS
ncbi:uncharacterized protein LOC125216187 [Salvia hispanica]|uniref:uncharacterized protein LOC125216187 n=1 Tax=Salvia hispanica TaxID=49212 RepID=UPI002009AD40|nr:uncharacterized protein LOC125216187 [Salvia hispanica]